VGLATLEPFALLAQSPLVLFLAQMKKNFIVIHFQF
jgi:hypothetical protein